MPEAGGPLRTQLLAFAHHVRDPAGNPPPPGVEDRRLRVYRDLFLGSIDGLLAGSFPVLRRTLGDGRWQALARGFYARHRCTTPLFTEVAGEFVDWLAARPPREAGDPPWLAELAHYEWIELDLQLQPDPPCGSRSGGESVRPHAGAHVSAGAGAVALSPLARPLAYAWPVHRIGPDWQPTACPPAPTLLLARRDAGGDVRFSELSPPVFRLLQLLDGDPPPGPAEALDALAAEAGMAGDETFRAQGEAMLQRLLEEGTLSRGP